MASKNDLPEWVGMARAAEVLSVRTTQAARELLVRHGIKLECFSGRAFVVASSDLLRLVAELEQGGSRAGRPSNLARSARAELAGPRAGGGAADPGGAGASEESTAD